MASFDFRSVNSDVLGVVFAVVLASAQKVLRGYQERKAETWPIAYGRIDRVSVGQYDFHHRRDFGDWARARRGVLRARE